MAITEHGAAPGARTRAASRVLTAARVLSLASVLLGVLYVLASPWVLLSGIGSAMTEGGNPLSVGELLGWVVVPAAVAIAALGFSIRARAQGTHLSPDDVAAIRGGWTARSLLLSVVGAVLMAVPWACMLGLALRDGLR